MERNGDPIWFHISLSLCKSSRPQCLFFIIMLIHVARLDQGPRMDLVLFAGSCYRNGYLLLKYIFTVRKELIPLAPFCQPGDPACLFYRHFSPVIGDEYIYGGAISLSISFLFNCHYWGFITGQFREVPNRYSLAWFIDLVLFIVSDTARLPCFAF